MRYAQLIVATLLIIGAAACEERPADDAAADGDTAMVAGDDEAIRRHVDAFVAAWNRADTATLASMVADDAVLMQPDGPVTEGKDAIVNASIGAYDVAAFQQSATVDEIRMLGDNAYARGTWRVDPTAAGGESTNGKWSAIYQRGPGGEFQVWRWMWNQPPGQTVAGT